MFPVRDAILASLFFDFGVFLTESFLIPPYSSDDGPLVTNSRRPLRLNVGFLVSGPIGTSRDFDFDFPHLRVSDDLALDSFKGVARVSRTPQGLLVQADFDGDTGLECVRCLSPFSQHLHFDFTELYAFNQKSMTDSGLLVPEDAQIDLEPLVRDYALLEIPISPLDSPECKGLCPVCGQNLNVGDCGHRAAVEESPFAMLRKLENEE
jgi:uncharacterized protein